MTSLSPQWCYCRIMLCFTSRSLGNFWKRCHYHLTDGASCWSVSYSFPPSLQDCAALKLHFSDKDQAFWSYFIWKLNGRGKKAVNVFPVPSLFFLSSFPYIWKIPALSSLCCCFPCCFPVLLKLSCDFIRTPSSVFLVVSCSEEQLSLLDDTYTAPATFFFCPVAIQNVWFI